MHDSYRRLFEVAGLTPDTQGEARMAEKLGVESSQLVHNWITRGVSKEGALRAQAAFGCNALWVLVEAPPKLIQAAWPFQFVPQDRYEALTEAGKGYAQNEFLSAIARAEGSIPDTRGNRHMATLRESPTPSATDESTITPPVTKKRTALEEAIRAGQGGTSNGQRSTPERVQADRRRKRA